MKVGYFIPGYNISHFLSQKTMSLHITHINFSARVEMPFRLHGIFVNFSARLLGLKIPARFLNPCPSCWKGRKRYPLDKSQLIQSPNA